MTLSATIQDITAVTQDIAHDPYTGDIRNAEVKFIDRETNSVLCIAPVGLVTLSDNKTGTATCDWVVDIGQADSQDFTIGIIVNDYYIRDASADNTILTISKPLDLQLQVIEELSYCLKCRQQKEVEKSSHLGPYKR